jgi:hypothetical protein
MIADEEEAKKNLTSEASDAEIIPENENRIFSTCNSDACPICFCAFGKLFCIAHVYEFIAASPR